MSASPGWSCRAVPSAISSRPARLAYQAVGHRLGAQLPQVQLDVVVGALSVVHHGDAPFMLSCNVDARGSVVDSLVNNPAPAGPEIILRVHVLVSCRSTTPCFEIRCRAPAAVMVYARAIAAILLVTPTKDTAPSDAAAGAVGLGVRLHCAKVL